MDFLLGKERLLDGSLLVELAAVDAFSDRDGNLIRTDIVQALNRMSSMLYILMIRRKRADEGH